MPQLKEGIIKTTRFDSLQPIVPQTAQCKVASMDEGKCSLASYNRRDFYKISLIERGSSQLLYANRGINIDRPALVFTNPVIPYSWESAGDPHAGYFCVFSEEFLQQGGRMESLQESTLFKAGGEPVYMLDNEQLSYLKSIFKRMHQDMDSEYMYQSEVLQSQLKLLIHEAIKMQPAVSYFSGHNAATRLTKLFLVMLEKQFPVESPQDSIRLKKAGDYAKQLNVHVNHLNAAVQEITGKSTTTLISERLYTEARSLLLHTDWGVAEIAYSLGFEYASYFNNFFKRYSGVTPLSVRKGVPGTAIS